MEELQEQQVTYNEDNIRHLSDMEHVRTRPGMYIGKLGDGSHACLLYTSPSPRD